MLKPNDILSSEFLDFQIFPPVEPEILLQQSIGENNKGLLVVIFEEETRTELLPFLTKILGAVKYDLSQDAQVIKITDETAFSLMSLCHKSKKEVKNVIFFGQNPKQVGLNLNVQKYQPLTINDQTFLFADDLGAVHDDVALKKMLWSCLQKIFK